MKYKLRLTKTRSEDFVELTVDASDCVAAEKLGSAPEELMGYDFEWCSKQERMLDKSWSCEVTNDE